MLVGSQVLLSIVLPTVIFPLVYLCSREDIMSVDGPETETSPSVPAQVDCETSEVAPPSPRRKKTYRSPRWVTALGYALFGVVIVANVYVIVELAMGNK
jgi:metal iron transporter